MFTFLDREQTLEVGKHIDDDGDDDDGDDGDDGDDSSKITNMFLKESDSGQTVEVGKHVDDDGYDDDGDDSSKITNMFLKKSNRGQTVEVGKHVHKGDSTIDVEKNGIRISSTMNGTEISFSLKKSHRKKVTRNKKRIVKFILETLLPIISTGIFMSATATIFSLNAKPIPISYSIPYSSWSSRDFSGFPIIS